MSKKTPDHGTLILDGTEYAWAYRHGSSFDYKIGAIGTSVSVWLHRERTRELILDFPFTMFGSQASPPRALLLPQVIVAIPQAIEAGWDPESRGKAFRYQIPDSTPELSPQDRKIKSRPGQTH